MNLRRPFAIVALSFAVVAPAALSERPALAKDAKDKDVPKPKTGFSQLPAMPPSEYIHMAVPSDYDPKKWYPLMFLLHSLSDDEANSKPEIFVGPWAELLLKRGWIIAAPKSPIYDNETSAAPLVDVLKRVSAVYRIDERRVVLVGHNAGGCMAWNLATNYPKLFAGVASFSGEIREESRGSLKSLAGKKVLVFRGAKDRYYTAGMLAQDKAYLESAKVDLKLVEKPGWEQAMPVPDLPGFADWVDGVYPAGAWKDKADAAEQALAAGDFAGAAKALVALASELKKSPYPAFEVKAAAIQTALVSAVKDHVTTALKVVEADPLDAVTRLEALVKALKGVKGLEDEAKKALAGLQKLPAVVEAVKKKEAEAAGSSYMEKAAAAEAKGDLAPALALYRKAAALALFSQKDGAAAKVAELEPKVGAK